MLFGLGELIFLNLFIFPFPLLSPSFPCFPFLSHSLSDTLDPSPLDHSPRRPPPISIPAVQTDDRYYYEKKFDECRGVIQPEMALPMGIPGAFGLPVSPVPTSVSII